jgi:hypothetical protein
MDLIFKERFMGLREKYFDGAPLPVVFYYTSDGNNAPTVKTPRSHRCIAAMVDNMDESFLTTGSWAMVKKRIAREKKDKAGE